MEDIGTLAGVEGCIGPAAGREEEVHSLGSVVLRKVEEGGTDRVRDRDLLVGEDNNHSEDRAHFEAVAEGSIDLVVVEDIAVAAVGRDNSPAARMGMTWAQVCLSFSSRF